MKFSIVIPTHRRHQSLIHLLNSVKRQNYDPSQLEIIIVTNLPDPFFEFTQFREAAEGLDWNVFTVKSLGVNKARNLGIKKAQGELLLLLDDDCELKSSNYLSDLESWHQRHQQAVAIGGSYAVDETASPLDRAYNCVSKQWQALDHFGDYRSSRLVGGNVCYKKDLLLQSGEFFDESIAFGGTESEFHERLNKKGCETLFIESLEVFHKTQLRVDDLVRKAVLQAQGHLRYKIDQGFSDKASRTYQNKRLLLARESSRTVEEFHEIVHWMNLFDWAYNYTCLNPRVTPRKVYSKSKRWSGKSLTKPTLEARL